MKPIAVMRWLLRVTPPVEGLPTLEPFAGTGTTLVAARAEGIDAVGVEREPKYATIARARLDAASASSLPSPTTPTTPALSFTPPPAPTPPTTPPPTAPTPGLLIGDAHAKLAEIPDASVNLCVTSPPYFGLRSYLPADSEDKGKEIGREAAPDDFVAGLVAVFRDVRRVLRDDGVLVLNMGDSYANDAKWGGATGGKHAAALHGGAAAIGRQKATTGLKPKDLCLVPQRLALALQADGWTIRAMIPWVKRNVMPESVTDRPTNSCETIILATKSVRCWWDRFAVAVEGKDWSKGGPGTGITPTFHYDDANGGNAGLQGIAARYKNGVQGTQRNRRTGDWTIDSIEILRAQLDGILATKLTPTLLLDPDAEGPEGALGLFVNPKPYKGAHYATFPEALVEPFIHAACPPKVCAVCAAPWVRLTGRPCENPEGCDALIPTQADECPKCGYVRNWRAGRAANGDDAAFGQGSGRAVPRLPGGFTNKTKIAPGNPTDAAIGGDPDRHDGGTRERAPAGSGGGNVLAAVNVAADGYTPACDCPEGTPTLSGVVLDPFMGSGTTAAVAERLGRRWIGIDLDARNAALVADRVGALCTKEHALTAPPVQLNAPASAPPRPSRQQAPTHNSAQARLPW